MLPRSCLSRFFIRLLAVSALCLPATVLAEGAGSPLAGGGAAYLAQLVVGLIIVLAAIVVLAFFMRRITGVQSRLGSEFRVVSGISLGARERMLLVQVGDKQLLVGVAPGRVQTLHVLDEPIATELPKAPSASESPFASRLRAALNRGQSS
ncbi:flagellar biosynthetic protein FliO [Thioalkalivibrio sulfidiphilus]|uniref:flagellar biosynthetic protein FliO n=1 Tax=Thioalkalivibrio sulfidiphilus TaxID=1033854 RepID=UPI000363332B|nr:flagellar biosynthetic protein FliO [Thioalkalivibrio sulfidiphilus]